MEGNRSKSNNGGCFLLFVVLFILELIFDRLILGRELFREGMKIAPYFYGALFAICLVVWLISEIFGEDTPEEDDGNDDGLTS